MKIVHFLPQVSWSIGGVVRAVVDLATVLAARGHDVELLTFDATDVPEEWHSALPGLPRVTVLHSNGHARGLGRAAKRVAKSSIVRADVLHFHGVWTPANAQLAYAARSLGKPYVITVHGMLDEWSMRQKHFKKRLYLKLVGRKLLDSAACVHFTAMAELEQARRWFRNVRVSVLPCPFDLSHFKTLPGPQSAIEAFPFLCRDHATVLFLGRLHKKKGVELLLQAVSLLQKRGCSVQAAIAGDGEADYERSLRQLSSDLGLQESVHFLGLITGRLKLAVYQAADVFVLPTSQENFGLAIAEAMGCGLPVVTTRGVDIWREIEAAGALVVDRSPGALADAIAQLVSDVSAREQLSRRGRKWVFDNLGRDRVADGYERLYRGEQIMPIAQPSHPQYFPNGIDR